MRAETWSRRLLVGLLFTILVFGNVSNAQISEGLPDVEGDQDASGEASLPTGTDASGNVTSSINGTSGSLSGDGSVSQDTPGLPDAELPGQPGILGIGSHAVWSFDLPLYNLTDQERFRFRSADGDGRQEVSIAVTWTDSLGRQKAYPEGEHERALLNLITKQGEHEQEFLPDAWIGNHTAIYNLSDEDLIRAPSTYWVLRAYAGNEQIDTPIASVGAYSLYNRHANSTTFPASAVDDAMDTQYTTVAIFDSDLDGHPDDRDNCPQHSNEDQANLDQDLHGDACDDDIDGDGFGNDAERDAGSDPWNRKSTPFDRDADGYNNTEEADARSDPDDPASTPLDPDADGYRTTTERRVGSDPYWAKSTPRDYDGDGHMNGEDNCPRALNEDQADGDSDGIGDACDSRPEDGPTGDEDADGIDNQDDNCRTINNTAQEDLDGDGLGDACDEDRDGDGYVQGDDAFPDDSSEWHDTDGDGIGDNADQDDDNDGLSDSAEIAIGTSPLNIDTDGDLYSDMDELQLDTDPLDDLSPDFRPTDARATGREDGSIRITWSPSGDERVGHYLVWSKADVREVALVDASVTSVVDTQHGSGDVQYVVQAVLKDQTLTFDARHGTEAFLFESEVVAWVLESDRSVADNGTQTDPAPSVTPSDQGAPAPAVWMAASLLAAVAFLVRRRS